MTKCPKCEKDIDYLLQGLVVENDIQTEVRLVDGEAQNILEITGEMTPKNCCCPECGYEFPFYSNEFANKFLYDDLEFSIIIQTIIELQQKKGKVTP